MSAIVRGPATANATARQAPSTPLLPGTVSSGHIMIAYPAPHLPNRLPAKGKKGTGKNITGVYPCTIPGCNEPALARVIDWEVHVKTHYKGGYAFPCLLPDCQKLYKSLSARAGHMKKDHPGARYE
ncbi:hypothetical protein AURDEDRAFT_175029 [Auricularia subglabra TFB-10046 SS5]|nr:hypothetical protein AURDEDRAFT_175029 [Auricularia subglabra TFB-10046 SS5]